MTEILAGTVLAAYLHPNHVSHSFQESMHRLIGYDLAHSARVVRGGGPVMFRCGPGNLPEGRNTVARHFLDESQAEWLWLIDSDMGFEPDTVDRLVEAAGPAEYPVVGALCFGLKEHSPDGMGGFQVRAFPTLYGWAKDKTGTFGFSVMRTYPANTLMRVAGTGAACLLIHRSILEKIRSDSGGATVWFDPTKQTDGKPVSEDLSFCYRVNATGAPVMVHTGVQTNHYKNIWVTEDLYRLLETQYGSVAQEIQPVEAE